MALIIWAKIGYTYKEYPCTLLVGTVLVSGVGELHEPAFEQPYATIASMKNLAIIKLGGSVITDKSKPLTAKRVEIKRLGKEIIASNYKGKLIIAHGSGSFGHFLATKYKTAEGYRGKKSIKGMVLTSDVAIAINRIVMNEFIKLGMMVKSFTASSFLIADNKKFSKGFIDSIEHTLKSNVTPVIFGDVVMDLERGFCIFSAEKVIKFMVNKLHNEYNIASIIYCTDTDGVYNAEGKTIPQITQKNFKVVRKLIGESGSADVTGGMTHKVEESIKLAKRFGLEVRIIDGNIRGNLMNNLMGKKVKGTRIVN